MCERDLPYGDWPYGAPYDHDEPDLEEEDWEDETRNPDELDDDLGFLISMVFFGCEVGWWD